MLMKQRKDLNGDLKSENKKTTNGTMMSPPTDIDNQVYLVTLLQPLKKARYNGTNEQQSKIWTNKYHIYPKYQERLTSYQTFPEI